jgi:hypothetical protein
MGRRDHRADHHREHHAQAADPAVDTENRTLEERLAAARSTLRFQDRRIADLEIRVADPTGST